MVEDRRIEKSKQAIKDAFLHQLSTLEPSKITVTSLAGQANITRKLFMPIIKD